MQRLSIDLGERSYDILIDRNLLPKVGDFISKRFDPSRCIVVTHPSVRNLFGEEIQTGLAAAGYFTSFIEIPEGTLDPAVWAAKRVHGVLERQLGAIGERFVPHRNFGFVADPL